MTKWPFARTRRRNIFLGVLAGIAARLNMTTFSVRALFLILLFNYSDVAIGLYLALAIVMPIADETGGVTPAPKRGLVDVFLLFIVFGWLLPAIWVIGANLWIHIALIGVTLLVVIGFEWRRRAKAKQQTEVQRVPVEPRSAVNYAVRSALAVGLFSLIINGTTSYFIYLLTIGLIVAMVVALVTRNSRSALIAATTTSAVVAAFVASIGMPLDYWFAQWYDGKQVSPVYAQHYYNYRYAGNPFSRSAMMSPLRCIIAGRSGPRH